MDDNYFYDDNVLAEIIFMLSHPVKEVKLLDITFAAGVEKLDKDEKEVSNVV